LKQLSQYKILKYNIDNPSCPSIHWRRTIWPHIFSCSTGLNGRQDAIIVSWLLDPDVILTWRNNTVAKKNIQKLLKSHTGTKCFWLCINIICLWMTLYMIHIVSHIHAHVHQDYGPRFPDFIQRQSLTTCGYAGKQQCKIS
jgi:hypothetical protein